MKIQKIEIENFRGFEGKHELICQPQVNLFVGANGSGKSSVLDLIGMFLNHIINKTKHSSVVWIKIDKGDINLKRGYTNNHIHLTDSNNIFHKWILELQLKKAVTDINDFLEFQPPHQALVTDIREFINNKTNIPIIKYFGDYDLELNHHYENINNSDFSYNQFNSWNRFFSQVQRFTDFVKWFIVQENIENREKIRQKNLLYENPFLQPVRNGINTFFKFIKYIKLENLRVENNIDFLNKQNSELFDLCADKNGETFNLMQLSKGERQILIIIADISRCLSIANPSLSNPLEGTGIVLIDEIETHLHPAWQREVIPALTATFPNIQFFITTHSPQVVSSVDRKDVFIIDDFKFVKNTPHTKGRDSNAILNEIFGVTERPLEAQKDFDTLYDLIDDPNKEQDAAENLEALKVKYGSDDPDWQRAKRHFEFLTAKSID